ncbi:MAG: thiamine pyrophosphate-dependent enzyme [Muribaculaceae bacterium]|nr:thiamine pyrophosphate-dependent enzyme [Muribaculaceae bacterium]
MNDKRLLLGDEALALGALNAGLSGVYAYPGTPSTEITEFIQENTLAKERGVHSHWSTNEKTAMEEALGMSFCGKRALVCMKHVGMNVAADGFVNSAMTGANGGLIVVAADDPSMHSSQNEQDSRYYGQFAFIPTFEPSSQQEAYDMMDYAYNFSEKHQIPVLMRMVTRLAHSRAVVQPGEVKAENSIKYPEKTRQWVLMPANSKVRYVELIKLWADLEKESNNSPFNKYTDGADKSKGIIANGIAYNYLMECFPEGCPFPVLKISQYPLPMGLISKMANECESLLVIEEGQPFIEERLRGLLGTPLPVYGKLSGTLPRTGELNPDCVREALGLKPLESKGASQVVMPRPPALCQGCSHRDVYTALNATLKEYKDPKVFGDIGCYTLGWLSPFNAIDSVVDMGASISMAKGAADAGQFPSIAIIGDSTFTHSGMTPLLDAINENTNMVAVISDNLTTGMTGGQDSQGTGKLEQICIGLGLDPKHVVTIDALPKTHEQMMEIFRNEIEYKGTSVVICRRECIQTARRHAAAAAKAAAAKK